MAEIKKYNARANIFERIWAVLLVRRLVGLAGLAMMITGYGMILNPVGAADVEVVTRHAVRGMVLVACGGVVEVLVLLDWARR